MGHMDARRVELISLSQDGDVGIKVRLGKHFKQELYIFGPATGRNKQEQPNTLGVSMPLNPWRQSFRGASDDRLIEADSQLLFHRGRLPHQPESLCESAVLSGHASILFDLGSDHLDLE